MHKIRVAALLPIALALLLSACGSSNSSSSSAGSTPASTGVSSSTSSSGATGQAAPGGSAAPAALITTKHAAKLGTVLAYGPKRLTVYLFEADKGPGSSCSGACAAVWPPVKGTPKATGAAMSADLGTSTRSDGTKQVTYKGHPLYLFAKDKDDGDAYGQGIKSFGAAWYTLAPSGKRVDLS